jgi:hypothetical protein
VRHHLPLPWRYHPRQTLRRSGGCLKRQLNLTARSESAVSKSLMIEILVRAGTFRMRLEQAVIRQAGISRPKPGCLLSEAVADSDIKTVNGV